MRKEFSLQAQGTKYIKIHDPYNDHPDYVVEPKQRVWFDIPLLRYPNWMAINILDYTWHTYLNQCIEFMESNLITQDDFVGFYDFEIEKTKRNLEWMKQEYDSMSNTELLRHKTNLKNYTKQLDDRRITDFNDTFPVLYQYLEKTL